MPNQSSKTQSGKQVGSKVVNNNGIDKMCANKINYFFQNYNIIYSICKFESLCFDEH